MSRFRLTETVVFMTEIGSRANEKIKYAVRLGESASLRKEKKEFFLEGARLCRDAAENGIKIRQAFFTANAREKYSGYVGAVENVCGECYTVTPDVAGKLSGTKTAQGVFCICEMPADNGKIDYSGRYTALENLQDPSNLGAVCRTAEALGLDGVIVSGGCDIYNPKALRAAMGSSLRINIIETDRLETLIEQANAAGMLTLASTPQADAEKIDCIKTDGGVICCVGNEGNGLSDSVIAACRKKVTIPMRGRAESLNASAAAAILMWEISRKG